MFICDHAGRDTPQSLNRLGLSDAAFDLHIAWDIGAGEVTRRLAASLDAPLIAQRYSRLVIDCNRAPGRADSIPEVSDGIRIPGNAGLSRQARDAREREIHAPYHAAIAHELDARARRGRPTVLVFMHSFTPRMNDQDRPWAYGVLRDQGSDFSRAVLARLSAVPGLVVGDNQPYAMDETDYSARIHARDRGLDYLELEMRQDLIGDPAGQRRAADFLRTQLTAALAS
ncbi:MAG TPA: N-formylglutamate amidohydrolase [Caulobacteraceae bacterium]|nr:N-formylglutamate amidohydrolase [Caulobacteraceae bacterium]